MTPSIDPTPDSCILAQRNEQTIFNLQESDKRQWAAIEALQTRLPLWALLLFSALTGLSCSLLTFIGTH